MSDDRTIEASSLSGSPSPETLAEAQQHVEETRAQLGETIEALADKADIKAQAMKTLASTKERIGTVISPLRGSLSKGSSPQAGFGQVVQRVQAQLRARPVVAAAGASLIVGLMVGRFTRRH